MTKCAYFQANHYWLVQRDVTYRVCERMTRQVAVHLSVKLERECVTGPYATLRASCTPLKNLGSSNRMLLCFRIHLSHCLCTVEELEGCLAIWSRTVGGVEACTCLPLKEELSTYTADYLSAEETATEIE